MHSENHRAEQANPPEITAAVLVIGDEILSGRTQDKNLAWLADYLGKLGIQLREARVIPDIHAKIVEAVNALRRDYTYVFTTGGIGPTPDDITAEAVAAAFGIEYGFQPEAKAILEHFYGDQINEARYRMAKMPVTARLIDNPVTHAPGFYLENVFVLAGVPKIMQAMVMSLDGVLARGRVRHALSFTTHLREGVISATLIEAMKAFPAVGIGSYPKFLDGGGTEVTLVLRGYDEAELATTRAWLEERFAGV